MESNLKWGSFKKGKGWDGLNNAAINTFNSDVVNSFVREIFQNSIDARQQELDNENKKKKLLVEINYKTISESEFPSYSALYDLIKRISAEEANKGHEQFFKNALADFGDKQNLRIFEYKDFNTTGLSGSDNDLYSTFNACVLSEGMTVKKDKTAGGSYGIGKNSIFGYSKIRTVLYSSFDGKEHIFQGVAKLASYKMNGDTFEQRIYFGEGDNLSSIRNFSRLSDAAHKLLKRDQLGLTQIAVCPIEQDNWVDEFIKAILRNYWPLLSQGELTVELKENDILKTSVSVDSLDSLMHKYFDQETYQPDDAKPNGNPYDYYKTLKEGVLIEKEVSIIGKVKFYYTELEHKKTNRIAYIRNGMVIYTEPVWGFSSIGYSGVIICDNEDGNEILRMMEPPTHDSFDPSRLDEKSDIYKKKNGEKILDEIKKIIRSCLNEILNKYRKKAETIPWLDNLLSKVGNTGNTGSRTNQKSDKETLNRISSNRNYNLRFDSLVKNEQVSTAEGDDAPTDPVPQGPVSPTPPVPPPIPPVLPPTPPVPPPTPPIPPTPPPIPPVSPGSGNKKKKIRFRIFRSDTFSGHSTYKIILDGIGENIDIELYQLGDSGNTASYTLEKIYDILGAEYAFSELLNKNHELKGYMIKGVNLPTTLFAQLKEPYKSSFTIKAS